VPVIYYGDEIGMTGAADPDNRRMMRFVDEISSYEENNLKEISKLIQLRRKHSALRHGDFNTLIADENVYAYLRSDLNERVLTVLNKSEKNRTVELNLHQVYNLENAIDLATGNTSPINNHQLIVEVPGIGWRMFLLQ
jgi:glycosidase